MQDDRGLLPHLTFQMELPFEMLTAVIAIVSTGRHVSCGLWIGLFMFTIHAYGLRLRYFCESVRLTTSSTN